MRRSKTTMYLLAGAATFALGACGGGDGPSTTGTTATTAAGPAPAELAAAYDRELDAYARRLRRAGDGRTALVRLAGDPPGLAAAAGDAADDPAYAAARETAARVDEIAAELERFARSRTRTDGLLYTRLYTLASRGWNAAFRRNQRHYDRVSPIVYGQRLSRARDRKVHRLWDGYMRDERAAWKRYQRRLDAIKAPTELHRSFIAYEQMEIDEAIAFIDEFREHLHDQPTEHVQLGYYTQQATKFSQYPIAVPVMWEDRRALIRGFVRSIGRLADGRDASVGDAYRARIADRFVSPLRKTKDRDVIVTRRLWMLDRVRQLEDTPEDAYLDARRTLLLEGIDDARNPYARLVAIYSELDATAGARKIKPESAAYLEWAHAELDRPTPPILASTVRAMDRGIERFPKVRSTMLFQTLNDFTKAQRRIERDMRRGARRVDDPRRLKRALRTALAATAPAPAQQRPVRQE